MQIKSLKGSITVFLSIIFLLIFSLMLTCIEGVRAVGGKYYADMLCTLSSETLLANYYYPLFDEYHIFGIDAGQQNGDFNADYARNILDKSLSDSINGMSGGIISLKSADVRTDKIYRLEDNDCSSFYSQAVQYMKYKEISNAVAKLFQMEDIKKSASVNKVVTKQMEVQEKISLIDSKILELAELLDGIKTRKTGICRDGKGNIKTVPEFAKMVYTGDAEQLKYEYRQAAVYGAVMNNIVNTDVLCSNVKKLIDEGKACEDTIVRLCSDNEKLEEDKIELLSRIETLKKAKAETDEFESELDRVIEMIKENETLISSAENRLKDVKKDIYRQCNDLRKTADGVIEKSSAAVKKLSELEKAQKDAEKVIDAYEKFFSVIKPELTEDMAEIFSKELEDLKGYVGKGSSGYIYNVSLMKQTLESNIELLSGIVFTGDSFEVTENEVMTAESIFAGLKRDGLSLNYGEIYASELSDEKLEKGIKDVIGQYISDSFLKYLGIETENLTAEIPKAERYMLPSVQEESKYDFFALIGEVTDMMSGTDVLDTDISDQVKNISDSIFFEAYINEHFSDYINNRTDTLLRCEKEYILFQKPTDKQNLQDALIRIVIVRMILKLPYILGDSKIMSELGAMAAGITGVAGLPALNSVVKYMLAVLWAFEEGLVETSMLAAGGVLPVIATEKCIQAADLFTLTGEKIALKKNALLKKSTGQSGAGYSEYLLFLSMLENKSKKCISALDIIQLNIRKMYKSSFLMANVIVGAEYTAEVEVGSFDRQRVYEVSRKIIYK